jgi:hypothetical protein
MQQSPLASRLLDAVLSAQAALVERTTAPEAIREGLQAVYRAIAAGLSDLDDEQLLATPVAEEWSMAEVVEHVHEHDRKYHEIAQLGVDHYVEHGLEHSLQLWNLRRELGFAREPGQHDGPSGTLR